jgi:anti-sigma B factor antagonist
MNITISQECGTAVASITGDITHAVAAELQEKLLALLSSVEDLVLDFGGIGILTSAGLRMLLLLYREAQGGHKTLLLAAVPESVEDVMSVTGFWEQFVTCKSVDDAIKKVTKTVQP